MLQSTISMPPSRIQGSSSLLTGPWLEATNSADESLVHQFLKAEGVRPEELIGTGFTYRHDWGNFNHAWILTLNWSAVNARSRVFVAIAEGAAGGPDGGKFIGAAKFSLFNVAPSDGQVAIWVDIDWGNPIRLYVDYLVINP